MSHLQLVSDAKDAIERLYSDTSVSPDVTKESLLELQEEIETLIGVLEDSNG